MKPQWNNTTHTAELLKYYAAKIKNSDKAKYCWGCRKTGSLVHYRWAHKMEDSWAGFFFLISTQLPYDPIITFLGIYPIEIKIYLLTQKRGIQMFITALFITATNWKELRCSSFRGWIITQTVAHPHQKHYSAKQGGKLHTHKSPEWTSGELCRLKWSIP